MRKGESIAKVFGIALVLVMIVWMLGGLANVSNNLVFADGVVTFPDPNLEAAIREAIGKPTGDIYQLDLGGLTELHAGGRSISDLSGLEHCTSLNWLDLSDNQISDISPLSGLTSLTWLYLGSNQISGITHLSGLTSLTSLDLGSNQISGITPLSGLTSLMWLDLESNQISDITSLSGLTSLTNVYLGSNQISDITPVSGLTSLTSLDLWSNQIGDISSLSGLTSLMWLDLGSNQISDITPLSGLTSLIDLDLGSNQISDISSLSGLTSLIWLGLWSNQISDITPVSGLTSLASLDLWSNQISDITSLSGLTSLAWLDLGSNQISDITPLSGLTSLTWLDLGSNQISDITPLSGLTSLTDLDLWSNEISDITPLSGLTSLTDLDLWSNQISDITSLSSLTNLTWLSLESNQISDITPLSGLTSLTDLYLGSNQISDITSLSGLTSLTDLDLGSNQISDITSLSGLTSLSDLYLDYNQISDIGPLVDNTGLAAGDEVDLRGNPLSAVSLTTYIPQLEARGVTVYYDAGGNNPPNTPFNPSPPNHATGVSVDVNLSWTGGDPDVGDTVTYDVYFDTTGATTLVSNDQSATTYDPGTLNPNTQYYWNVVATDNHNVPTTGPVWDFTTVSSPSPGELHVGPGQPYATIQEGIDDASDGDTIIVHPETYDGFTVENKNNIGIIGQEGVTVNSANMFVDGGEWWAMAVVMNSTNINIEGIVFDGEGTEVGMIEGITYGDSTGSIDHVAVRNIIGSEMAMGVCIWGGEEDSTAVDISYLTVENCSWGIMVSNAEANLDRCSITGIAPNGGYGIMAMDNARVTVENCDICDCWKEAPEFGEAGIGVMVAIREEYEAVWGIVDERPSTVNMAGCTVSNNNGGICVYDDGNLIANFSNIVGNDLLGVYNEAAEEVDATNNWWGDASGPEDASGDTDCKTLSEGGWNCDTCDRNDGTGDKVSDNVDYCPWLLESGMAWNFPSTSDVFLCPTPANSRPYLDAAVSLPTGTEPAELLGVYWLDEATGGWQYFIPAFGGGTLTSLEPGEAYLVAVSGGCGWNLPCGEGTALPTGNIWNFPSTSDVFLTPTPANSRPYLDAAVSLPTGTEPAELLGVYWLGEATGGWQYFIPAFGGGTLTSLEPGEAYLVAVSGDCSWQIS
jgi:internalin A